MPDRCRRHCRREWSRPLLTSRRVSQTAVVEEPPRPTMSADRADARRTARVGAAAAALVVAGSFLPWQQVLTRPYRHPVDVSGVELGGVWTAVLAVIAAALLLGSGYLPSLVWVRRGFMLAAGTAAIAGVIVVWNDPTRFSPSGELAATGEPGRYLCLAGALTAAVCGVRAASQSNPRVRL